MSLLLQLSDEVTYNVLEYLSKGELYQFCNSCTGNRKWLNENKLWLSKIVGLSEIEKYVGILPFPRWKVVMTSSMIVKCGNIMAYVLPTTSNCIGWSDSIILRHVYDINEGMEKDYIYCQMSLYNSSSKCGQVPFFVRQGVIPYNASDIIVNSCKALYHGIKFDIQYRTSNASSEISFYPFMVSEESASPCLNSVLLPKVDNFFYYKYDVKHFILGKWEQHIHTKYPPINWLVDKSIL